jgi:site-specific DNA-cytosine methylase
MVSQVLRKLELFAGAGGLSYTAQELEACAVIISSWANDINPSACATYVANKPYTFVSPLPATTELLLLLHRQGHLQHTEASAPQKAP